MTPKTFLSYLQRDEERCWHCGTTGPTLVPQHRVGRGMGGSKTRDLPSNVIVMCSYANGLMESDAAFADYARSKGWKLGSWQRPDEEPVWDVTTGVWFLLDNEGRRAALFID